MSEKLSLNTILIIGAGVAVLVVIGVAAVLYLLPALGIGGGGFTRLDEGNSSVAHRDGLVVTFQGGDPLAVNLDSQPREQFVSGQAGGTWTDAFNQLPSELSMLSPIYTIEAREEPGGRLYAEMNIPNGAEPLETLSLYAWDEAAGVWVFMPSRQDIVRDVIGFTPTSSTTHVAAFQQEATQPGIGLVMGEATTLDSAVAQALEFSLPRGVTLMADGTLNGEPVSPTEADEAQATPLVSNADGYQSFADTALNETAFGNLSGLAASYDGLALDFAVGDADRDAFSAFVTGLADRLHGEGKTLAVVVRSTTLSAYDLQALSSAADRIWWAPGDDPTVYLEGGSVQNVLYSLVGDLDRRTLGLLVSSDTVDVSPSQVKSVGAEDALEVFGEVAPIEGYLSEENSTVPGEQIPFRLTGPLQAMAYDSTLGANYVAYTGEDDTTHYIYFGSAESLSRKLDWANRYGLNAVAVESNDDALSVNAATTGLSAFIAQTAAAPPPELSIAWQVLGAEDGATLTETAGDLSAIQFLWVAEDEAGDYTISATVNGQASSQRGDLTVTVGEVASAPQPQTQQSTETETETTEPVETTDQTPVVAAGAASGGGFELGGQVRGGEFYGFMHQSGMTWVKYQFRGFGDTGGAAALINEGHANGMKVLLSVIGGHDADLNAWAQFMGQMAALGPDAIEVWNEPNFSREWPGSQPTGDNYVNSLLAPAYNAIKAANPNVMVISGAPTPTGAFPSCPSDIGSYIGCNDNTWISQVASAGGANFMDCVGVHFNAGATSPSATSGHPAGGHYSWYFGPMVNVYSVVGRPLCFTEFGYAVGPNLPQTFAWANDNTVEEQAAWLAEAAALASGRGVRLMIVWNVGGFGGGGGDPQGAYSIVRGGGCPACQSLGSVMGVQ